MPNPKNFWTQQRQDGKWETKREGTARPLIVTDTQAKAWTYTKALAKASGGEAFLKGQNGRIRKRNTYGPDPFPPPG